MASHRYVYDGQHIALELMGVTNESDASSDVYRRIMHGVAIDEVLAEETAWGTSWALSDHLGTIHDWVDATTGTSTHYVYSAFGRILSIDGSNPSLDEHLFGFTGRETDADTGITDHWMYYRARYYNPSTGRFVSQDPIGFLAGDANLYRYVGNEATGATDPSGLETYGEAIRRGIYGGLRGGVQGGNSAVTELGIGVLAITLHGVTRGGNPLKDGAFLGGYLSNTSLPTISALVGPSAMPLPLIWEQQRQIGKVADLVDKAGSMDGDAAAPLIDTVVTEAVGAGAPAIGAAARCSTPLRSITRSIGSKAGHVHAKPTIMPGGTPQVIEGHATVPVYRQGTPLIRTPDGTSVTVLRPGVEVDDSIGRLIASGDWESLAQLMLEGDPLVEPLLGSRTHLPNTLMPERIIYPPGGRYGDPLTVHENSTTFGVPKRLSEVLMPNQGNIVVAACSKIENLP